MLAAEAGHYDVVQLLLQHDADINERNLVGISLHFLSVCLSVCVVYLSVSLFYTHTHTHTHTQIQREGERERERERSSALVIDFVVCIVLDLTSFSDRRNV